MPDKIDAHKQWNGETWTVNLIKNPNQKCSTSDCSECKQISVRLQAAADAAVQAEQARQKADVDASVAKLAEENVEKSKQDRIEKAAQAKGEALRRSGLAWTAARDAAVKKAADATAKAEADHAALLADISEELNTELAAADKARADADAKTNATDWLAATAPKEAPAAPVDGDSSAEGQGSGEPKS